MTTVKQEWFGKIDRAIRENTEYVQRGRKIIEKYRDDRKTFVDSISYNLLFSNTETLRPVLYNRTPKAEGRALKRLDPITRKAAGILEDSINNLCATYDFDYVINSCLDDYLLPGMGLPRVVYNPIIEEKKINGKKRELKVFEELFIEYVHWESVLFIGGSKWEDITAIAFRGVKTKDQVKSEFGTKIANKLKYSAKEQIYNKYQDDKDCRELTEIWEVWDKEARERLFLSRELDEPISIDDDPLGLEGFYPVPRPMMSVTTNDTMVPVPFFVFYQDLQEELDEVSTRIRRLVEELKRRGIYDAKLVNLSEVINASDNTFIAVENYDRIAQNGGIDSVISEMDITRIAQVLQGLYQQRDQIKQAIYEIVGISDIQRAQTDPRETLGAQKLKGQYGSLRVSDLQREVQRMIRDIFKIKAEIIAEQFSPRTISLISHTPVEEIEEIMPLLRLQTPRMVSIDIESDSTIAADEQADKEQAIEFINAMTGLTQALPDLTATFGLDVAGEIMTSATRRFKMSRNIDEMLERHLIEQKAQAEQLKNQPPQPTPEEIQAQLEMQKMQIEQQKSQAELQLKFAELQLKQQQLALEAQEKGAKIDLAESQQALEAAKVVLEGDKLELEKVKVAVEARSPVNEVVGV